MKTQIILSLLKSSRPHPEWRLPSFVEIAPDSLGAFIAILTDREQVGVIATHEESRRIAQALQQVVEPQPAGPSDDGASDRALDYPAAARSIALWLAPFCDRTLPYPNMIAEAARRARAKIDELEAALGGQTDDIPF